MTRFGRGETGARTMGFDVTAEEADLVLGTRRARAAALLTLALPGSAYLYQGEELGLPEVEDLPDHLRRDPTWQRSGGAAPGRDGCRVPLPWRGHEAPFGFGPAGSVPWLPQPEAWRDLTVQAQEHDPESMLTLYRTALRLRRRLLRGNELAWLPTQPVVLAFERGATFRCVVNLGRTPYPCPDGELLLASGPLVDGVLPSDTAVWLAV